MPVTVKTVSVTYDRKQNLGDFSSANIGVTIWADVTDEDLDAAMHALWSMAKENVKAQLLPLTSRSKATVEQVFMGLPLELQETIKDVSQGTPTVWLADDDDDDNTGHPGHPKNYGDK